jgi:beta-glucosidase
MSARPFVRGARRTVGSRWGLPAIVLACVAAIVAIPISSASSAPTPVAATVAAAKPVVLVRPGDVAHVAVTLTTAGGQALDRAVTVGYQTGATLPVGSGAAARSLPTTATAGSDYTPASGSVTFPAGTASGTSLSFDVQTLSASASSEAKAINIALSSADTATNTSSSPPTVVINAHGLPYLNANLPISQRVNDLLSRMSLAEKIGAGGVAAVGWWGHADAEHADRLGRHGRRLPVAGARHAAADPADLRGGHRSRRREHGRRDRLPAQHRHGRDAQSGADPRRGSGDGAETRATGPEWGFAPCLCVARDVRWGRTYESFGEDPALVSRMETEIDGLLASGRR